jgi:hypothetical protein
MGSRYTVVPMIKIQPGMILAYNVLDPRPSRSKEIGATHHNVKPPTQLYTGKMTQSAKKRLAKAINLLVAIALPKKAIHFDSKKEFLFRVNFITLTLPAAQGDITDADLKKKCLKPWIEYWKEKLPGMSYVWRAERQGNGNLHFHLLTDRYIHYKDIRDSWNRCLKHTGLIESFFQRNGHRDPNSTDVHAVKAIRNLAAYMVKYMSKKEEEGQIVQGRLWDCSKNLKAKDVCAWPACAEDGDTFDKLYKAFPNQAFSTEHCGGIRLSEKQMHQFFPPRWKAEYSAFLKRIRMLNDNFQLQAISS